MKFPKTRQKHKCAKRKHRISVTVTPSLCNKRITNTGDGNKGIQIMLSVLTDSSNKAYKYSLVSTAAAHKQPALMSRTRKHGLPTNEEMDVALCTEGKLATLSKP